MKQLNFLLVLFTTCFPLAINGKKLEFVQIVWRHGDRSPTETYRTDPFQESSWQFGGGGFGQLSPTGMKQHLNLGKMLRARYVEGGNSSYNLLPKIYDSKKMYVRSTGINRTLISAMSNMLGMYGQDNYGNRKGIDYPEDSGWPVGYVPIPIHTVDYASDCIGNMDCDCPRREWLWSIAQQTEEMQNWLKSEKVSSVLSNLTNYVNQKFSLENLWIVPDALFIEQIYFNETLRQKNSWFNDDFYNKLVEVNDRTYMYEYGVFDQRAHKDGMDIGYEILRTRTGGLLNEINDRMRLKKNCNENPNKADCIGLNDLKYFAYSAHDETVYAILCALDIEKEAIKPHGYPHYSAAVIIEYWTDNGKDLFRIVYHKDDASDFEILTSKLNGCSEDFCDIEVFNNRSKFLQLPKPVNEWCQVTSAQSVIRNGLLFIIIISFLSIFA